MKDHKKPLGPGTLEAYVALQKQANDMAWDIGNHLGEVVNSICDVFGVKHPDSIYFDDAAEGDIGVPRLDRDFIEYIFWAEYGSANPDISTSETDFLESIPKEYMYIRLDQVKADVRRQINFDKDKKVEQEAKRAKASNKKKSIIDAAKAKLTKTERKALGL